MSYAIKRFIIDNKILITHTCHSFIFKVYSGRRRNYNKMVHTWKIEIKTKMK